MTISDEQTEPDAKTDPRLPIGRMQKRADYLRAASGRKSHSALFTVQAANRSSAGREPPRIGLTVTRKVGGAVERNRIKRRLRCVIRTAADLSLVPSHDYVIVARRAVLDASVLALRAGLRHAIETLHAPRAERTSKRRERNPGRSDGVGQGAVTVG